MENSLLDTAFLYVIGRDVWFEPSNHHVDPDKKRLHELERLFPAELKQAVEEANRRAEELLAVACELAELSRGPNNDFKGPYFDTQTLEVRCPGFSLRSYELALNESFMLTR
jgi:hypothetical protein